MGYFNLSHPVYQLYSLKIGDLSVVSQGKASGLTLQLVKVVSQSPHIGYSPVAVDGRWLGGRSRVANSRDILLEDYVQPREYLKTCIPDPNRLTRREIFFWKLALTRTPGAVRLGIISGEDISRWVITTHRVSHLLNHMHLMWRSGFDHRMHIQYSVISMPSTRCGGCTIRWDLTSDWTIAESN